ncbi:DnaJ-domain-containing protein [Pisolithus croceorrhizus]|nr:DnaJ-domain-containing protein [Pisolithus croceorrhizus]
MVKQSTLTEAYAQLGLEQGAPLEQVRSAYKQLALRLHPDKNQGDETATTQFQRLGEAYSVIQRHLETGGHSYSNDDDDEYFYFDSDSEEYGYYYDDGFEAERMAFFMYLFEEILMGRSGRGYNRDRSYRHQRQPRPSETLQEREARMQRQHEEQVREEQRRAEEEQRRAQQKADRKAFEARMRETERKEAEQRKREKSASKKAEAEVRRRKAAESLEVQQRRAQTLRSAAFAAARAGDAQQVKKAIWEDSVDPAGGEVKLGCDSFIGTQPQDPTETLLHIATQNGDVDLVKWLDAHSADPEERNSLGLSAFHVALHHGQVSIMKHFLDAYSPHDEDHNAIYSLTPPNNLLSMALESVEPQVVWMILDRGLASPLEISDAWTRVTSTEGRQALLAKMSNDTGKYAEIQNILMSFGGFTPPPTPLVACQGSERSISPPSDTTSHTNKNSIRRGSSRGRGRGAHDRPNGRTVDPQEQSAHHRPSFPPPHGNAVPSEWPQHSGRGKQRGRGRGRGRGRSRGRGN